MRAIALYARVSSEQQARQATIESQLCALRERATADGHQVLPGDLYVDNGYSGTTLSRPALERLRDRVAEGMIDIVYATNPDRLARRYAYQVVLLEEFAAHHVEVVFLQAPTDRSPEDTLVLQVQGMLAEYERAKIVERGRRGRLHKAKQGSVNALGGAPFGYRYVRKSETEPARYEIVPEEADQVRRVFEALVHQHASLREIARRLTAERVPTRRGAPRWDGATVHGMLRNPAYKGSAAYGKTEIKERGPQLRPRHGHPTVPGQLGVPHDKPREQWISIAVPSIVSEELFAAANEQLERNRHQSHRGRRGYLLQGLVVCALCGYGFYGVSTGVRLKDGHRHVYYRCGGANAYKFGGKRLCANTPMRADTLDAHVWSSVRRVLEDPERVIAEWSHRGLIDGVQAELQTQRDEAAAALERVEASLRRLLDAYENGVLDLEELNRRTVHIKGRRLEARDALLEAEGRLAKSVSLQAVGARLSDFVERVAGGLDQLDWEQRRQVIRTLVARIEIGDDRVTIVFRLPPPNSPGGSDAEAPAASGRPPGGSRYRGGLLAASAPSRSRCGTRGLGERSCLPVASPSGRVLPVGHAVGAPGPRSSMRIALLYPPPGRSLPGAKPPDLADGPPPEYRRRRPRRRLLPDPLRALLAGRAGARAGHEVKVAEPLRLPLGARRGCAPGARRRPLRDVLLDREPPRGRPRRPGIRAPPPPTHVLVGGPHATPLAAEMLAHHPEIDTWPRGESEPAFLELLGRLAAGRRTDRHRGARPEARTGSRRRRSRPRGDRGPRHASLRRTTTSTRTS